MEGNMNNAPVAPNGTEQAPLPPVGQYNIKMCQELMTPMEDLMGDIFDLKQYLPDAEYLKITEKIAKVVEVPFYVIIKEQSKKKAPNRRVREKVDNRKMIRLYPDKYEECKICGDILQKKSMKCHIKSDACRDKHYAKKAALIKKQMNGINDKIVEMYDSGEPLPEYTKEEIAEFPSGWWNTFNQ